MTVAREEILDRVRRALADVPPEERPDDVPVERGYRRELEDTSPSEVTDWFCRMVEDYNASVYRTTASELRDTLSSLCRESGLRRVVLPSGLPAEWRPDGVDLVEDHGLDTSEIDGMDGVLTGCAAAIAQTGTLVLDGGERSGRRVITLVPDHHLCVVEAEQVVGLVPEALARVAPAVHGRRAPITLVSGPSATSDIELDRVEGVHGPRTLQILLVEPG